MYRFVYVVSIRKEEGDTVIYTGRIRSKDLVCGAKLINLLIHINSGKDTSTQNGCQESEKGKKNSLKDQIPLSVNFNFVLFIP